MRFLNKKYIFYQSGFTLIELIIVIAVIALLAAATFVAVDPAKRIGQARDAQRWQDITAIADAIQLYIADNNGDFPTSTATLSGGLSNTFYYLLGIGTSAIALNPDYCPPSNGMIEPSDGVLLANLIPTYLPTMPVDPSGFKADQNGIGYYIKFNGGVNNVIIGACEKSDYTTNWISIKR